MFAFCISQFAFASAARAEIVVFKNGRTMSVKSHRVSGEMATVQLRDGGEVTFPASIVERVDPDEVPYPDPATSGIERDTLSADAEGRPVESIGITIPDEVLATRPFAGLIASVAASHAVDARLVHAVIEQESNYQARARSKKGARGLMQLMPATAREYRVRNAYDPKANINAGIQKLKGLLIKWEGDVALALAAYNAGEGAVARFKGIPPYRETQNYVSKILSLAGLR